MAQLPQSGVLAYLDDAALNTLGACGEFSSLGGGALLIKEGDSNERLYVLVEGELEVFTTANGKEIMLATLSAGDCVGEVSIFQPGPTSASVRGKSACRIFYLAASSLETFLQSDPWAGCALIWGINTALSQRLVTANQIIKSNKVVPSFLSVRSRLRK